jgi:hypothetical protein
MMIIALISVMMGVDGSAPPSRCTTYSMKITNQYGMDA